MKITCQACQAKYTIADDKVAGKVVKIRCKKCGASIVVNGNQNSPDATQPTASGGAFDPAGQGPGADGGAEGWTVNVADGDQRTMTEPEIVTAYGSGIVTDDTFCWKEGMADWLPLQEIAPLLAACRGPLPRLGGSRTQDDDVPTRIHDPSMGPIGTGGSGVSAPGLARAPSPAPGAVAALGVRKDGNGAAAAATARRAGGRGPAADLFGGVAQAGGEDEVLTSAPPGIPQAHVDAPKPGAARNESNLLFGGPEQGNAAAAPSMSATSEASGLIDIRQLSAQMRGASDDGNKKKSRVEDIMNLGGGGAFSPSLAAPILSAPSLEAYSQPPPAMVGTMGSEAPPPRSKALVFLAVSAGLFFLVAAASVGLLLLRGKGTDEAALVTGKEPLPATSAPPGATTQGPSVRGGGETPQASAAPAPDTSNAAMAPTPAAAKETPAKEARESSPAAAPAGPKEPKAPAQAPAKESAPAGAPAAEFNMGEARARLASIAGGVQSCKRGETAGAGKVEIVFAPSGAVQSASLMPGSPFDGSPTGKCVEARFRGARVPPFGGSPFTVSKSFSIN